MNTNSKDLVTRLVIENLNEHMKLLRRMYEKRHERIFNLYGAAPKFDSEIEKLDKLFEKRFNDLPKIYGVQIDLINNIWNAKCSSPNESTSVKNETFATSSGKNPNPKDKEKSKGAGSSDRPGINASTEEPGTSKKARHESVQTTSGNSHTSEVPDLSAELFNSYITDTAQSDPSNASASNLNTPEARNGRAEFEFEFFLRIKQK